MRGIDKAEKYYEEFGAEAIHEGFPELEGILAVGLAGSGSECFGFDDEISEDHDFEPGFCIWIPEEDVIDAKTAFRLERMYARLPKEYMGLRRNLMQPAGGNRRGVLRFSEFLERHIGRTDADLDTADWFRIPESCLAETVNGQVWRDDCGAFTELREKINAMPENIRLKKLAGSLYVMGQSGAYNYPRCIAHGEKGAAQLSLAEFAKHTAHTAFLLNRTYMPFYKWSFRALRSLTILPELAEKLEYLLNTGNAPEETEAKRKVIEDCTEAVIGALGQQNLADGCGKDLGDHAEAVNRRITDGFLRSASVTAAAAFQ